MMTALYLKERKPENLVAWVNLEVVPRGIYQVGDKQYLYAGGQPKFVIMSADGQVGAGRQLLDHVELIVEEYKE